jgi:hypothetical protein
VGKAMHIKIFCTKKLKIVLALWAMIEYKQIIFVLNKSGPKPTFFVKKEEDAQ